MSLDWWCDASAHKYTKNIWHRKEIPWGLPPTFLPWGIIGSLTYWPIVCISQPNEQDDICFWMYFYLNKSLFSSSNHCVCTILCTNTHLKRTTAMICHWEKWVRCDRYLLLYSGVRYGSVTRFPCLLSKNYSVWHIIHHHSGFFFIRQKKPARINCFICVSIYSFFSSIWIVDVQFLLVILRRIRLFTFNGIDLQAIYLPNLSLGQRERLVWGGRDLYTDKLSRFEAQINAIKICKDRRKKHPSVEFIKYLKWKVCTMCMCCIISFDR